MSLRTTHPLPLCGWSPRKDDRWSCSCGNEWNTFGNTFDTGGYAPPASLNGLRRNASPVSSGRHIRIGMPSEASLP